MLKKDVDSDWRESMEYRNDNEKTLTKFVDLLQKAAYSEVKKILADDLVAYVTNSKGGVDEIKGREAYMQRIYAMDLASAEIQMNIMQIVTVAPNQVLMMVEVHAEKAGRKLLNHAAHLVKFNNNQIQEMWMVEALPAYSDEFWLK